MLKVTRLSGAGLMLLVATGLVCGLSTRSTYAAFILSLALTWGLVGIGLAVLTGWGNQISLAQGAFFGVGAYAAVIVSRLGLPFLLALLLVIPIGVVLGILAGLPSLRLRGSFLAVATLAVQFIIEGTFFRWGYVSTEGSEGFVRRPELFFTDKAYFWLALAVVAACLSVVHLLGRSQTGRILRALRGSGLEIQASGHSLATFRLLAGVISTVVTLEGGVLFAGLLGQVSYRNFGFGQSVTFLTGGVIGGIGSLWGAFLGLCLAALLPEGLRFTPIDPELGPFVLAGASLLVLWTDPGGLVELVRRVAGGLPRGGVVGNGEGVIPPVLVGSSTGPTGGQ